MIWKYILPTHENEIAEWIWNAYLAMKK